LPSTEIMPAIQTFHCDTCGKALIWESKISGLGRWAAGKAPSNRVVTRYVALSFRRVAGGSSAPGQAVECIDARAAIRRAKLMAGDTVNGGSVAFSRRGSPEFGEFDDAVILKSFGNIPKDFDIA
jgi:hypothetical protein